MTSTAKDDAQWLRSFEQQISRQLGVQVPKLALIHETMTQYIAWLQAAAKQQTTLEEAFLIANANGMTETGSFFNRRLAKCKSFCPQMLGPSALPGCANSTHDVSGSLSLFREFFLLSDITFWQRFHDQQRSHESLEEAAYWIKEQQKWCASEIGKTRLALCKTENKRLYDQLYHTKCKLQEYLAYLRHKCPKTYLIRLGIYGPLTIANTEQQITSAVAHSERFDAFLKWAKELLRSSLVGFHATLRASTLHATLFWDVCLVVDSQWWPDQAELRDYLHAQSIQMSRCVDEHFTAQHSVYEWMKNATIKSESEWDTFWQQYIDQCIEPMLYMLVIKPKDFRLVRSGRLPRKKSKN